MKYEIHPPFTQEFLPVSGKLIKMSFVVIVTTDDGVPVETRVVMTDWDDTALYDSMVAGGATADDATNKVKNIVIAKSIKGKPAPAEVVPTKIELTTSQELEKYAVDSKAVEDELAKL